MKITYRSESYLVREGFSRIRLPHNSVIAQLLIDELLAKDGEVWRIISETVGTVTDSRKSVLSARE